MIEKAYAQLKEGYFEDACEAFSGCLQVDPSQAKSHYGRGAARFKLKRWKEALADFQKAKELNPEDPEYWVGLAMCLAADNKIYEAIGIFEELLGNYPQYVRGHIQLAQLYYRLGVITKGHKQLDIALAARPSLAERKTIETLKNEQLALDKRRYYRPDFEALRKQNRATGCAVNKTKRDFVLKKGVLGLGLPVALLMSLTVSIQVPGHLFKLQGFNFKTFVTALALFTPIFIVAGYVWGRVVYKYIRRDQ